jgi:hypothetical protein
MDRISSTLNRSLIQGAFNGDREKGLYCVFKPEKCRAREK